MALTDYTRIGVVVHELFLWNCRRCHSLVTNRELHDDWHEAHANHGHPYTACYGPSGAWDVTTGPIPAKSPT